jgi:malonate transporter
VAIVLGACLAATGVVLPVPIDRLLAFLGSAAGPTALFALGGVLAVHSINRSTILAAVAITIVKLLIYPLLVWYVLAHLLHVEPFWVHAGVMLATLPSAGSNYILAQRYAAETRQVSAAIVLSTMLSVLTVPLAAWLMLGQ